MIARITTYRMKPDSIPDATALVETMKSRIMALRGMKQFISTANGDGTGYVIAIVDSVEDAKANEPEVAEIWAAFGDYLLAPPEAKDYDITVNWQA